MISDMGWWYGMVLTLIVHTSWGYNTCMLRRRYYRILFFFASVFLSFIWWEMIVARLGFRRWVRQTRITRLKKAASRFRNLAIQMGGVMIKAGQFLSARLDVLPSEITDELSGLQDEVPAEDFEPIKALIESEFGMRLEEKFSDFDHTPMAAASIGQVYYAHLCVQDVEGVPCPAVVVKVQRPHIREIVGTDLSAIRIVGKWLNRYRPIRKRADMLTLIEEFSNSLAEEMDYLQEGRNAETFAAHFKDHPGVRVPDVIWSHTTEKVLTLQDVGGIKISDYASIEKAGISRTDVAERLLETYLKQIFEDRFFHADPHPGNLFVQPGEQGWKLTFIDFGMTGVLSEKTYKALREILIAVGTQNSHRLVQAFLLLDVLLPGTDLELIERAGQRIFERFWGKSTSQLREMHLEEAREFIKEFGDLMFEMPFQAPENIILLGRCVNILSGMCMALDPQFDIWKSILPYVTKLVNTEMGSTAKTVLDEVLNVLRVLISLPTKADHLITKLEQGRLEIRIPTLVREMEGYHRSQRRMTKAVIFAAFLLSGVQLYVNGNLILAGAFGVAALLTMILLIFQRP